MTEMNWDNILGALKNSRNSGKKDYSEPWKAHIFNPKLTSAGTYDCVIRFLPRPVGDGDGNPILKVNSHAFQDSNGWYIDLCPTTYGEKCPVCSENSKIYKSGNKPGDQKRKTYFYSNILVVKDPQNPENEGKVFIYRFGKKLNEIIMDKVDPKNPEMDTPINIFHPKLGTNYRLKIKLVTAKEDGKEKTYPNTDASTFNESIIPLADDVIASFVPQLHKLSDICSPEKIKSYEQLEERFNKVKGYSGSVGSSSLAPSMTETAQTTITVDDLPSYAAPTVTRTADDGVDGDDDEDAFIKSLKQQMGG